MAAIKRLFEPLISDLVLVDLRGYIPPEWSVLAVTNSHKMNFEIPSFARNNENTETTF